MRSKKAMIIVWMFGSIVTATAQTSELRGPLQQRFIINQFISPQFAKGGEWKIRSEASIDSLFQAIENAWYKAAPDTLKKYPQDLSLDDFKSIDAYCYFWALLSMSQQMNLPQRYERHLVDHYMMPAMKRDYKLLKKRPSLSSLQLVHAGTLGNTIAIGSESGMDKETVLACYQLYNDFDSLFTTLSNSTDTAIQQYAKKQWKDLQWFKYDLAAKQALYSGDLDKAEMYVLTGLSTDQYPKRRIAWISSQLLTALKRAGAEDKAITLLNTLLVNTTVDNLRRDTLLAWYQRVDPTNGKKMYDNTLSKLSTSAFKRTGQQIKLPAAWNFIVNAISADKVSKASYFVVDVWETSCGPCLAEIPDFNRFYEKYGQRGDVLFISVNTDYINGKNDEHYVLDRSKALDIRFPVVYDNAASDLNNQLAVHAYPSKFILDRSGNIIAKTDGSDLSLRSFELFINELK